MVELGHESTLPVTMDDMVHHAKAVGRKRREALLIVDMPWLSFHLGPRRRRRTPRASCARPAPTR
jgi:3-methyl-2-oxobutanoate hydroxymethyltransferase